MKNVLIVSSSDKGIDSISDILKSVSCKKISLALSCGEARRIVSEKNYDLFLIINPIGNESGEDLAREFAQIGVPQVILIVKNENYGYISDKLQDDGVITITKPISKSSLLTVLKFAKASWNKLDKIHNKNLNLLKKIDDIRILGKAKCFLISNLNITENDAHKFIEKKAMDSRKSNIEISQEIIKKYS